MLRFLTISRHERVAVIRDGQYVSLLEPGRRWIFTWPGLVETVRFDVRQLVYGIDESDVLPAAMPGTEVVHVLPSERVVVRVDGVVLRVLTAGRYRLWDASGRVELLRYDAWVTPVALADTDRLEPAVTSAWTELVATDAAALVLRRDGDPVRALPAGRYRVWAGGPWSLERVWLGLIPL